MPLPRCHVRHPRNERAATGSTGSGKKSAPPARLEPIDSVRPWSGRCARGPPFEDARFGGIVPIPYYDEDGTSQGNWELELAIK
jgi:hypothetical protein